MPRHVSLIARRTLLVLTLLSFLVAPGGVRAADDELGGLGDEAPAAGVSIGSKAFDAVLLRPLGVLLIVTGAGLLVPASIMALPHGRQTVREGYDFFVGDNVSYTFDRPLGEL